MTSLLHLSEVLVCVGITIQAAETCVQRRLYVDGGLYDWTLLATTQQWTRSRLRGGLAERLFRAPAFLGIVALQGFAALALVLFDSSAWAPFLLAVVLAGHLALLVRNQYGLDGSDQMITLVLAALFVYRIHPTRNMELIASLFLAGQLVLSYFTAGFAKLSSKVWRGGTAVANILRTTSYGSAPLSRFLHRHPRLNLVSCWAVILYECFAPLAILFGPRACLAFLAGGFLLHLSIAIFMGLNIFFWSFISTYPAIYYCSTRWSLLQLVHARI